ncbi:MAG: hypothetical protein IRZ08_21320 [Frankia sp.]|nr:hypothetical protein [Frankia sp.]
MTIGSSVFLIVVGAILRYAVTWRIHGLDLKALGLILTIAGIITLIIRLIWVFNPALRQGRPPADPSLWPAERRAVRQAPPPPPSCPSNTRPDVWAR